MSSSSDVSKCAAASSSSGNEEAEISSNKKVSTSCDQKVESCNNDSASDNTSSNSNSGIDAISNNLGRVDLSKDGLDKLAISDDKLFQDPPPKEDCPLCLQLMPHADRICGVDLTYQPCCGKTLCYGCVIAANEQINKGNLKHWCPCCRVPLPNSKKELLKRFKKRMKLNDADAFFTLGGIYYKGDWGMTRDHYKSFELWKRAAELGPSSRAHYRLGEWYYNGRGGAEKNMRNTIHHWQLAAMGGHEVARHALGLMEETNDCMYLAMKHYMISAKSGFDKSLKKVGEGYKAGLVTKDEYTTALRAYQSSLDEMKSKQRDIAAAHDKRNFIAKQD